MIYNEKKKIDQVKSYHEKRINKTIYRITSVYMGQFELGKAIEDLIVKKILRGEAANYVKAKKS